ncbi:MAG TPA: hypothetical protein VF245_08010 [Solirubrobacterales bacterium]
MAVGVAVAVAGVAGAVQSPTLVGADGNTQSMGVKITPTKRSKTQPTPATLEVTTATGNPTRANGVPIPATRAVVDFPKGVTIFTKGYPTCDPAKLQNTSTEKALEECKRAQIGGGEGSLDLVVGEKVFPVVAGMTIFNGIPQGGKPVILLHLYSQTPIQTTVVLVGVVKSYNKQGFGARLDVTIPLLAGGQGAVTGVKLKVFKKYSYKGKQRSFISATCPTTSWKSRGEFVFLDGESLTPSVKGKCAQKK